MHALAGGATSAETAPLPELSKLLSQENNVCAASRSCFCSVLTASCRGSHPGGQQRRD
jgi:hypothetical protein